MNAPVGGLFDYDAKTGRQAGGWTNKLIWGDNNLVLASLKNGPLRQDIETAGGLQLVYIDPPFDVGSDFSFIVEVGGDSLTKEPSVIEDVTYRDTWGRGTDSYLAMLYPRLNLIWQTVAQAGNVFVHVGPSVSHLVRELCDEVFGGSSFRNEIVWQRHDPHNDAKNKLRVITDRILWYGKGDANYYDSECERTVLSASAEAEFSLLELPTGEVVNYSGNQGRKGRRFKLDDATWKGNNRRFECVGQSPRPSVNGCTTTRGIVLAKSRSRCSSMQEELFRREQRDLLAGCVGWRWPNEGGE